MKFKVMVDDVSFKQKPATTDVALIQNRFRNKEPIELDVDRFFEYIGKGHTICASVMEAGAKDENFISQQLMMVDVDNEEDGKIVNPREIIDYLKENKLDVLGYYHTFNSTDEKPKFRLIFLLDKPLTEVNRSRNVLEILIENIPQSDKSCKNPSRLFYGTDGEKKEVTIINQNAIITLEDVVKLYKPSPISNDTKDSELKQLVADYDLLEFMKQDNEISYTGSDYTSFKNCVICGHSDCLRYYPKTNSWYCFGANGSKGGTIIDYLKETKKLNVNEAINYFKYELLKLPKEHFISTNVVPYIPDDYIDSIKTQVSTIGLHVDDIDIHRWVKCDIGKDGSYSFFIHCPKLTQYIREELRYIFVKNNAKGGILRYFYFDGYYKLISDDELKGLIKTLIPLDLHTSNRINEVLKLLYTDLNFVRMEDLNANENIINFENGILYLDTDELKPHSPSEYSTIRIPCNYNKEISVPKTRYFDKYIDDLTANDEEIKRLIFQFMGVVLSNVKGSRMKKSLFMVGPGDTGKSQIKIFMEALLGKENCSGIDIRKLEDRFGKISLLNKRLVGSNDMGFPTVSSLEIFKLATGGDSIHAEYKGENVLDFTFNGILWFCCNELPKFGADRGNWVYNRIVVVECNNIIPEEKQDKELVNHLLEEKDYIISLAINGLKQVIKNGYKFNIPDSCKVLNDAYKVSNNSFLTFMQECTIDRVAGATIKDNCTKGTLFKVYKAWCKDNNRGYHFETKGEIKKLLIQLGKYHITKTNNGNEYYSDFTLSAAAKREYSEVYGYFDGDVDSDTVSGNDFSDMKLDGIDEDYDF